MSGQGRLEAWLHLFFRDTRYSISSLDCRSEMQLNGAVAPAYDADNVVRPVSLSLPALAGWPSTSSRRQ